jgi:HAD superfamily hydrolase (TIGR01509 family)
LKFESPLAHPIQAVIFDCDGTLVDSEVPSLDVLHAQACALGINFTREQAHHQFRGVRMADCIAWIGAQLHHKPDGFELDFARSVRRAQAERFNEGLEVIPGAFDLLEKLTIPFCVATNGPREKVELTLGLTGLLKFFPGRLFSAYEVGIFKPDPGLFLYAARVMGVAPECCAVVEDSLPGIQAGLAAGMQVYALLPPAGLGAEISQQVRFITDLTGLDFHELSR